MNLVFDVGNTETVLGLFDNGKLQEHWRIASYPERTVDELGLLVRSLIRESGFDSQLVTGSTVGSVVPQITPVVQEMCERHLGVHAFLVTATSPLPIRLDVDEPFGVGADRIVNTLAAARLYRRDTIAVDLGTATTFDCITADGVFHGGVIAPGVRSGADNLIRRTAKLPRVDLEPPEAVIGRRTETAVRSGIFFGVVDAIDGMVRRIKAEWKRPEALVVATGGFAALVAPHCTTVDRVEPFLTLIGLDMAHQHLAAVARQRPASAPAARPAPRRR
jgi:type III pantothenate kinase